MRIASVIVPDWRVSKANRRHRLKAFCKSLLGDPASVGLEVWTSAGEGTPDEWRAEFKQWKAMGVTHITLNNTFTRGVRARIAGRTMQAHLDAMRASFDAVKDLR